MRRLSTWSGRLASTELQQRGPAHRRDDIHEPHAYISVRPRRGATSDWTLAAPPGPRTSTSTGAPAAWSIRSSTSPTTSPCRSSRHGRRVRHPEPRPTAPTRVRSTRRPTVLTVTDIGCVEPLRSTCRRRSAPHPLRHSCGGAGLRAEQHRDSSGTIAFFERPAAGARTSREPAGAPARLHLLSRRRTCS